MRTSLNVRHADEQLRGTMALPHGAGKDVKIAVFAKGDKAKEAEQAGADVVGADDLAKKIEEGFDDFDVDDRDAGHDGHGRSGSAASSAPPGKMPNPKVGTVTNDLAKAIEEAKAGKVEYRTDRTAIVHLVIGKTLLRGPPAARELRGDHGGAGPRQALRREGPLPAHHHDGLDDGSRA